LVERSVRVEDDVTEGAVRERDDHLVEVGPHRPPRFAASSFASARAAPSSVTTALAIECARSPRRCSRRSAASRRRAGGGSVRTSAASASSSARVTTGPRWYRRRRAARGRRRRATTPGGTSSGRAVRPGGARRRGRRRSGDRKSTRLNSSHVKISYAVFCLKKKNKRQQSIDN